MRASILPVICAVTIVAVVLGDSPRPNDESPPGQRGLLNLIQIRASQSPGGNARNYYLDLPHDRLWLVDTEGNLETRVVLNDILSMSICKDDKGAPDYVCAGSHGCGYVDLNCDGEWDVWTDARGEIEKWYVWCEGVWKRVRTTRPFVTELTQVSAYDGSGPYMWNGNRWIGPGDSNAAHPTIYLPSVDKE